jgi:hypothetical protein
MERTTTPLTLRAAFEPATFDESARTVELVWSTGAAVLRRGYDGPYLEELSMAPDAVRLGRLNAGAPLLNSHNASDLSQVLGVVERAWIDGNEGRALVRFSGRAEVEPYFQDVKSGVLRNISVGYLVHNYEKRTGEDGAPPTYRATDWEPHELSLVPIPADAAASVRAEPVKEHNPMDEQIREEVLEAAAAPAEEPVTEAAADPAPEPQPEPQPEARAIALERQRAADIITAVSRAKLPDTLANELIRSGASIDEARAKILDTLADQEPPTVTQISVTRDAGQTLREGALNALEARAGLSQLDDKGRRFWGLSLMEMAREFVEAGGTDTRGMSRMELAGRALHSTSDFPTLLATLSNKSLAAGYAQAPQTFRPLVREANFSDFREKNVVSLDGRVTFEKVNEGGEFKRQAPFAEGLESYRIYTYGKVIAVTRQVLINDDLDGLSRIPQLIGRAAADFESEQVWALLTSNPTMGDGVALFHANHKNLGTGVIGVTGISAARKALRTQVDLAGNRVNLQPRYLVVPAELETTAQTFLSPIQPAATGDVNIFTGSMSLIVEPRLDASSTAIYYVTADPSQIDMIELGYLDGQRGPVIETRNGFDVDGVEIKARLDFGCKVLNHRGFYRSTGV